MAGPRGMDRRDVRDGADVEGVRAERLGGLRASADVGELHREGELVDLTGELERDLGLRIADDESVLSGTLAGSAAERASLACPDDPEVPHAVSRASAGARTSAVSASLRRRRSDGRDVDMRKPFGVARGAREV